MAARGKREIPVEHEVERVRDPERDGDRALGRQAGEPVQEGQQREVERETDRAEHQEPGERMAVDRAGTVPPTSHKAEL
jgi:hypothetical protein